MESLVNAIHNKDIYDGKDFGGAPLVHLKLPFSHFIHLAVPFQPGSGYPKPSYQQGAVSSIGLSVGVLSFGKAKRKLKKTQFL